MPETKYAKSDNVNIAYQVIGNGTLDLDPVAGGMCELDIPYALVQGVKLTLIAGKFFLVEGNLVVQ